MKIGIDARLWNETGVGRYIRNLIFNLAEIDKKNDYVLFMLPIDIKDSKWQISNDKWKIVPVDIRWHTLDEQLKFPQILNKENLDLVHFPYFSIPINYKKPFVITIHDLILNHFPTGKSSTLPFPMYQLKRMGYKWVISNAVKNAKKIIVPLNAVKMDLLTEYSVSKDKIAVTYEGVDQGLELRSKNQELGLERYFLYVGNAYPHKNLERLIKAFALFRREQHEDIQLLLVGKNDYFYKKLGEKIIMENYSNIIIRNNVSDKELANLYGNAIALVSPSLMEGFGLPVLEAMSSKCLVLASDIPSFSEVCQDSAVFFDPYSVEDINTKLDYASELDQKTKDEYISSGFERSREFSWEKMARETLKIYESSISL